MGIFRKQSRRLLRPGIETTQDLAQELFAILNSDDPIEIDSPLDIQSPTGAPPIRITMPPTDDTGTIAPPITYTGGGGPTVPYPVFPPGTFTPTVVNVGDTTVPPPPVPGNDGGPNPLAPVTPTPPFAGGGVGFYGRVVGRTAAQTFDISYAKSDGSSETVSAVCENLAPSADLPPGLGVAVFVYGNGTNYFLTPVWI